eukprot:10772802-Heterocapsa_arctica.AAC.1
MKSCSSVHENSLRLSQLADYRPRSFGHPARTPLKEEEGWEVGDLESADYVNWRGMLASNWTNNRELSINRQSGTTAYPEPAAQAFFC